MDAPLTMDEAAIADLSGMFRMHASGSPLRSHGSPIRNVYDEMNVRSMPRTPEAGTPLFTENETSLLSQFLSNIEQGLAHPPPDQSMPQASTSEAPHAHTPTPLAKEDARSASPAEGEGPAPKRRRHIVSEQRRRNQIRHGFTQLSELLDSGRQLGARALGLNAGAGTGVEDEDLDDRTDNEEDLSLILDEEEAQRRRRNAQRRARSREVAGKQVRGRGRGRGGSTGGSGSKSAVLFQVIDLLHWLDARNAALRAELDEMRRVV